MSGTSSGWLHSLLACRQIFLSVQSIGRIRKWKKCHSMLHKTLVFTLFIKYSLIFFLQKIVFIIDRFNSHCQKFICRATVLAWDVGCDLLFLLWKTWNTLLIQSFYMHEPGFSQFQRIWQFLIKMWDFCYCSFPFYCQAVLLIYRSIM